MEDPESKNTLMNEEVVSSMPLTLCNLICRIKSDQRLTMQELCKWASAILILEFVCAIAIRFMRTTAYWLPVIAMLPTCLLYVVMYLNLLTGPWGSENSRFWCDVKIMYVRGYNTIRTVTRMFSISLLFMFLNHLLGHSQTLATLLLILIIVVIEWQSGLAENANQYDIKALDKFMDDDRLCLESLHYFQLQKKFEASHWMSFVIAFVAKLYTVTCVFITSVGEPSVPGPVFQIPIIIMITLYSILMPTLLDFIYFKSMATFCQVEIMRTVSDVVFPFLVVMFSLV